MRDSGYPCGYVRAVVKATLPWPNLGKMLGGGVSRTQAKPIRAASGGKVAHQIRGRGERDQPAQRAQSGKMYQRETMHDDDRLHWLIFWNNVLFFLTIFHNYGK